MWYRVRGLVLCAALFTSVAALISCTTIFDNLAQTVVDSRIDLIDRTGPAAEKPIYDPQTFVNWETPHVSPLAISPDGARLYAVNTPAARLEVFDISADLPALIARIPVGLEPLSVKLRSPTEAWVVNNISDSVSVVDLTSQSVIRTLHPGNDPMDVGFAAERAWVACSQPEHVACFELRDLDANPTIIPIQGSQPRSISVSADGKSVYVGIFSSGNYTTLVPDFAVSDPNGPYGGLNPPPTGDPLTDQVLAGAPPGSVIVRKNRTTGRWEDEHGADWSRFITWDLHDHDLARIDAESAAVSYISGLMNLVLGVGARPDGIVAAVGTQADNTRRFEPRLTAQFVHSVLALVDPASPTDAKILDLNPQLADAYATGAKTVPPEQRAASLADPRGVTWSADSQTGYVVGLGSNNVAIIDAAGGRITHIPVGQGPTGAQLDEPRGRLYVLNRFDASVSVIDTKSNTEIRRISFPDPTPEAIRVGRPFLYDAHKTSGLGVTACAACHVDGRTDHLAWDLGNPSGTAKSFDQNCDRLTEDPATVQFIFQNVTCEDFHPVKGPFVTQTLQGIIGTEPLHWRGDRASLADFNPAYVGLNGRDSELSGDEMRQFSDFLATIHFPPNPFRAVDNSLPEVGPNGGNAQRGRELFFTRPIDGRASNLTDPDALLAPALAAAGPIVTCSRCHQEPAGTDRHVTPRKLLKTNQSMKVPQLRNMYEKLGFNKHSQMSNRGFGYTHDGSLESLDEFLHIDIFDFGAGAEGDQRRTDVIAFALCFSDDTHGGVGQQVTLRDTTNTAAAKSLDQMIAVAETGDVGLITQISAVRKNNSSGVGSPIAYVYQKGGAMRLVGSDEEISTVTLRAAAAAGAEQTWTLVPAGAAERILSDAP